MKIKYYHSTKLFLATASTIGKTEYLGGLFEAIYGRMEKK